MQMTNVSPINFYDILKYDCVDNKGFCLFVCLFVFWPTREFFTQMETSPLPVKGCKSWQSWSFSTRGSLACPTYYNTGHPFVMVISEDTWHNIMPSVWHWAVTTSFYDLGLSRLEFEHPTFRLRDERSNLRRHRREGKEMNNSDVIHVIA